MEEKKDAVAVTTARTARIVGSRWNSEAYGIVSYLTPLASRAYEAGYEETETILLSLRSFQGF